MKSPVYLFISHLPFIIMTFLSSRHNLCCLYLKACLYGPLSGLFWRRQMRSGYSRPLPDSVGSVGVLVVYPAVDSVFQNAVMAIADFLQSHRELNVIIDVWQRGSVAEHGPLRWLNSQVGCAEKVLIILPPQDHEFSTDTGNMPIGTVPFKHFPCLCCLILLYDRLLSVSSLVKTLHCLYRKFKGSLNNGFWLKKRILLFWKQPVLLFIES